MPVPNAGPLPTQMWGQPPAPMPWLELVGGSSGVLRIITVVEHLQRVGSDLSRRGSIATVATIRWPAHAQHAPTP